MNHGNLLENDRFPRLIGMYSSSWLLAYNISKDKITNKR